MHKLRRMAVIAATSFKGERLSIRQSWANGATILQMMTRSKALHLGRRHLGMLNLAKNRATLRLCSLLPGGRVLDHQPHSWSRPSIQIRIPSRAIRPNTERISTRRLREALRLRRRDGILHNTLLLRTASGRAGIATHTMKMNGKMKKLQASGNRRPVHPLALQGQLPAKALLKINGEIGNRVVARTQEECVNLHGSSAEVARGGNAATSCQ